MERRALALGVLFTAEVLVMLDGMVVPVSLPRIAGDVGLDGALAATMLLREAHLHWEADVAAGPGAG